MFPLRRTQLALLFSCHTLVASAQQGTMAAGGEAGGTGGSLSLSAGQVAWTTAGGSGGTLQQGVQQAYQVIPTALQTGTDGQLLLTAFPNPASDQLTIHANTVLSPLAEATLLNAEGRLVRKLVLKGSDTLLDMGGLATGTYHLEVRDGERPLGRFNVIKH
jgi:hypothetical protein